MTTHDRMREAVRANALSEGELVARWMKDRPTEEQRIRHHVRRFLDGEKCTVGLAIAIIDLIVDQSRATRH